MNSIVATSSGGSRRPHTNAVIEAGKARARDEQEIQSLLQTAQRLCRIYNPEIEPEHETTMLCDCAVHKYWEKKVDRLEIQDMWSKAVIYPGEKPYHDCTRLRFKNTNPYSFKITSPFNLVCFPLTGMAKPDPHYHLQFIQETLSMDSTLNRDSEAAIQAQEPAFNIWELEQLESLVSNMSVNRWSSSNSDTIDKSSKRTGFRKAFSIKSSDERTAGKIQKKFSVTFELRNEILAEEQGRWQSSNDIQIVKTYQENLGIAQTVAELRAHKPRHYLHLLRAGYFEPIITSSQGQIPNLLRFSIDAAAGWRGFTTEWRGYKDIAEERLYWILSHRPTDKEVSKPDLVSELDTARARMATARPPIDAYDSPDDICDISSGSQRYSSQVPTPPPKWKTPISRDDETMVLLDTTSSMDNYPMRPEYRHYLITSHTRVKQPKSKGGLLTEVTKSVIRRFINAMGNHDNNPRGYPLAVFSQEAEYIGKIHRWDLDEVWRGIRFAGKARVMAGWQKIKELHLQKHSGTASYHPLYGWMAGPLTPRLKLLLVLNEEASDMNEFELELLSLPWAYITIFLIGVEGSLNHHRHANRLSRMSEVNHRISFVEAQGNIPERFITHELLKRHLGYEISMSRFKDLERELPEELPSPVQRRHERTFSDQSLTDDMLVELPSPEETRAWQSQQQYSPSRAIPQGLAELPGEREPTELPATESRRSMQTFYRSFPGQNMPQNHHLRT
ncbi:hypothetical protein N7532_007365 [Penicillium argentinense]|uniref:Uncharacterized protein n=1 Tax=Penicillium argentinense TaxID=1131581 RepID=A0A9W9F7T4_9EURO|nr:uncharacterized protein N7532_007365 [Penicillium argentinense]KAJ5095074.1 hypothetical protein N7532_007365 [Penicillium argentinense]